MKVKIVSIILMATLLLLTGCNGMYNRIDSPPSYADRTRFIATGNTYVIDNLMWTEYVDSETDNLYLCNAFSDGSERAGLSPLYDEEGNIAKCRND